MEETQIDSCQPCEDTEKTSLDVKNIAFIKSLQEKNELEKVNLLKQF